jgi:DNA processing protein
LAIVGSRRYSHYGQQAAAALVKPLAANGLGIVSGLAIGLDTLVHDNALAAGGSCIAVPGSGVETEGLYPKQNRRLAERILAQDGLVISEFAPGTPVLPSNFPRRNRVISGLSLGVLVLEAALRSGSLITARWALEQNREVLALPGNIFQPLSAGCNQLIQQGAKPVGCAADVLAALGRDQVKTPVKPALSELEEGIWLNLSQGPLSADELSALLNQDIRVITSALSKMQLTGLLADYGGGLFGQA